MKRLFACCMLALSGFFSLHLAFVLTKPLDAQAEENAPTASTRPLLEGWTQPTAVLFVTGQQYGYIEPCGCTGLANQKGGLARRASLLDIVRKKGWPVLAFDAGNQVRRTGVQQELKFQRTVDALRTMNYSAVGFGPDDLRLSFDEVLASLLNSTDSEGHSDLFVSANANLAGFVNPVRVLKAGPLQIGVTSVLNDDALNKIQAADVEKKPPVEALRSALQQLKQAKSQYNVLMAQATADECRQWAKALPGWDLIICAEGVGEPTFQAESIAGTKTSMIQVGSKGMYVGLVGLTVQRNQLTVKYERIALDARFPDAREMRDILAGYQDTLKEQGLNRLGLKPVRHPNGQFVGSETCGECHTQAFEKWQNTPHAHATESIVHPTERSDIARHFDPECLSCHVTGWNPQGYFPYETGYLELEASKAVHANGCENCHGPGKAHAAAESGDLEVTDAKRDQLREQMRLPMEKAHDKCLECHDLDNSPDFHLEGAFEKYWEQIKHPWRD